VLAFMAVYSLTRANLPRGRDAKPPVSSFLVALSR